MAVTHDREFDLLAREAHRVHTPAHRPDDDLAVLLEPFVAIMLAFFAVAVLFVLACDRTIGPDEGELASSPQVEAEQEPVAA
jgi:hypothetical protein